MASRGSSAASQWPLRSQQLPRRCLAQIRHPSPPPMTSWLCSPPRSACCSRSVLLSSCLHASRASCLISKDNLQACTSLHVDLIGLDLGRRLPFRLRPGPLQTAVKRGLHFELCYAPALRDEASRRNIFANATGGGSAFFSVPSMCA